MKLGDSPASCKQVHFQEPPSFQVVPSDSNKILGEFPGTVQKL